MKIVAMMIVSILTGIPVFAQTYEQEKAMDPDWGASTIH